MSRLPPTTVVVGSEKPAGARTAIPCITHSLCDGCGLCIARCPTKALIEPGNSGCAKCVKYCTTMEVSCAPARVVLLDALCDGCGACVLACPQHAIEMMADCGRNRAARG
jgi:Pyruvate/2-oxoacid:ferredoxin oxidoreductase delta subunit